MPDFSNAAGLITTLRTRLSHLSLFQRIAIGNAFIILGAVIGTRPQDQIDALSPREREVLQLIAEGYTNKQIAEILSISIKTVQAHRNNLMQKLDLHDRGELIKYAIQKKIIEI